jgi:antitoxin component of MazEF toxin-antitoxin module
MVVNVNYNTETDETYIVIPDQYMLELDWQLGDELKYEVDVNKFVTIINVTKGNRENGKI